MATIYWTGGAADGDWQNTANWSGAAVPVDDDVVIFDGRTTESVTQGTLDSESGATGSGALDVLHIKSDYTGSIGSATEPLAIHADKIIIEGSGTYYINCAKDNQSTDADIDYILVLNESATVFLYSNANDGANTCQFTNVYAVAGTMTLAIYTPDTDDQGVYVANLYMIPLSNKSSAHTATVAEGCLKINGSVAMNLYMKGGTITTDSSLGTVFQSGGTLNIGSDGGAITIDQDVTDKLVSFGGTINWYPDDDSDDSYINRMVLVGAAFDSSATTNNDRAKVLGNGADDDIVIGEAGVLNVSNGRSNITLAASSEVINVGGTVDTDLNQKSVETGVEFGIDLEHA